MVENIVGPSIPVVFYDGEQEINIGGIRINPMMDFKTFQFILSQRIGISPNQISIYLCDHKSERKRIPITGKVNFGFICREKDCFFLAVLKRSRKSRNRKAKTNGMGDYGDYLLDNEFLPPHQPENLILLRRNQPDLSVNLNLTGPVYSGFGSTYFDQISQTELSGLNDRLQNLKIQRENYAMAMARSYPNLTSLENPNPNSELDPNAFPSIQDSYPTMTKRDCKECSSRENGEAEAFHHCVNDPVINGWFRTRFGPIRPASKTPP